MKAVIDRFDSLSDWGGSLLPGLALNDFEDYVAGNLQTSLKLVIPAGSNGGTLQKLFDGAGSNPPPFLMKDSTLEPARDFDQIVFHIKSTDKGQYIYRKPAEFAYKISFGAGFEYYIPAIPDFTDIVIAPAGMLQIDEITITCLHNEADILVLSYMLALNDEIPSDILTDMVEAISGVLAETLPNGIFLGKVTCPARASEICVEEKPSFLKRYAQVKIVGGGNEEIHTVNDVGLRGNVTFGKEFDGETTKNSFADADCYLQLPVQIGGDGNTVVAPSIAVWGFEQEVQLRGAKLDKVIDTFKTDGTVTVRYQGELQLFDLLIDCEAQDNELIQILSTAVRKWVGREIIWINGRKYDLKAGGKPTYVDNPTPEILPKNQFRAAVEIREDVWPRQIQKFPMTTVTAVEVQGSPSQC